jgi:hypothetical protein
MMNIRTSQFGLTAVILLIFSGTGFSAYYQVTHIGDQYTYAMGINSKGNVTGYVIPNNSWSNSYAIFWNQESGIRSLGGHIAFSINESDQIAGQSGNFQAGIWENGSWVNLANCQTARSINLKGQATGLISSQRPGQYGPYRMDNIHSPSYVTLAKPYDRASDSFEINNNGEIASECASTLSGKLYVGVLYYSDGHYKILNDLGNYDTRTRGINDTEQIVGYTSVVRSSVRSAVFWNSANSSMEYMGSLGTGDGFAYAINNSGQAVGSSSNYAFIWTKQEGMRNLNNLIDRSLGITLTDALDISNNGSIVALGVDSIGIKGSYILTVPEPTSLLLLSLGGMALRKKIVLSL